MKKATKESKNDYILQQHPKGPGEGSSIVPYTPDEKSDSSSSSHSGSDDEEGFLQTNDEELKGQSDDERTETDGYKKAKDEKVGDKKDEDEKTREEQAVDDQARNEQAREVQTEVCVPEQQIEKPTVPLPSSSLTLSSAEYGNQFLNDNADMSLNDVLNDPVEIKVQSMVDVLVHQENPAVQKTPLVDTVMTILPEKTTHSPKTLSPKPQPPQSKTKIIIKNPKQSKEKVDVEVVLKRLMLASKY
ncbi:hypothetical protein Tco_1032550 [Tanacetum coccineum]|uniref:Uncharacterized protein n=1 Tax=Tanacetum coccineum TaxID=301880 RepID=A0ABQ5GDT6_9ASTR